MTLPVILALAAAAMPEPPVTWGNIVGRILSGGSPAAGARVCVVPDSDNCTITDINGGFLISGIPLNSWDGRIMDVAATLGDRHARVSDLLVPPGALNSPEIQFSFANADDTAIHASMAIQQTPSSSPPNMQPAPAGRIAVGNSPSVFATREGLVDRTTANGHRIVENDHFAALPSRRGLGLSDTARFQEFEVAVTNGTKTVRLPVWDVGPWNTKDDWWNIPAFRQSGQNLPRWTPWAEAAFVSGYNGGLDQSGRTVKNPAGIDLGDGAFRQDLSMTDNGLVGVRMLWQLEGTPGQRVRTKHWTKVRATPGGAILDTVGCGANGTLLSGPDSATVSGHWYLFYQVRWDDGSRSGWSVENYLDTDTSMSCTEAVHPATDRRLPIRIVGDRFEFDASLHRATFTVYGSDGAMLQGPTVLTHSCRLPNSAGIQLVIIQNGRDRQILRRIP